MKEGDGKRDKPKLLNQAFMAKLQKSPGKSGWTYVIWPKSVAFFGTRGSGGRVSDPWVTYPQVRDTGEKSPTNPHQVSLVKRREQRLTRESEPLRDGPVAD